MVRRAAPLSPGSLEAAITRRSAEEMVTALGLGRTPGFVRTVASAAFSRISTRLGRVLADFDRRVEAVGLAKAAAHALEDFGATWTREGQVTRSGPLVVVANHPGAYDALVLLAAIERPDVVVVATDRAFLRALPSLARHLLFVNDDVRSRTNSLRAALRHLAGGGAILHFGAGRIEPDPAFPRAGEAPLAAWAAGVGTLVRAAMRARGFVTLARVSGVHSPRAKRLFVTRLAERHGVTTLAPLVQVALPGYGDVAARVRFGPPLDAAALAADSLDDAALTARVRDHALRLFD